LRGIADLRLICVNSVAVVGSRATATTWPSRWPRVLAERGIGVVCGGAKGYVFPNSAHN
jgi:predicted Rossmann fold nucleotide-binding protein DprA/Smf involved in DNA uptake